MTLVDKIKQSLSYIQSRLWYIITIAIMAFTSGAMLIYEFLAKNADPILISVFQDLDLAIAYIFLTDFIVALYLSPMNKFRYIRQNWLDLLGSIPFSDGLFRAMRILRFTRLVRLLRALNTGLNIKGSVKSLASEQSENRNDEKKGS
jgi:type II secretory pathway component PulF